MRERLSCLLALAWIALGCEPRPVSAETVTVEAARPEPTAPSEVERPTEPPPAAPVIVRAPTLELTFVGDIVLGTYLGRGDDEFFVEMHPPQADPFADVAALLAADVVVGNLESPVTATLRPVAGVSTKHRFGGSGPHVAQLQRGGFTVLSLANNHAFDLGVDGQLEGAQVVADAGMLAIGSSRVATESVATNLRIESHTVQGWRIGFLACSTVQNHPGDPNGPRLPLLSLSAIDSEVVPLIEASRSEHDILIVVVHWGREYADDVSNSRKLAARQLIDAGVDLVIGHHPHVLQAIERRSGDERDGLIAYSLGNFLFPRGDPPSDLSAVLRVRYRGEPGERACLEHARVHPVHMVRKPRWHPEPSDGWKAVEVRDRLVDLSRAHATKLVRDDASEDLLVGRLRRCPSGPAGP